MAGDFVDEKVMKFTGAQYYFNSYTKRGRLNIASDIIKNIIAATGRYDITKKIVLLAWVMATYGTLFLAWAYSKSRKPKTPAAVKK